MVRKFSLALICVLLCACDKAQSQEASGPTNNSTGSTGPFSGAFNLSPGVGLAPAPNPTSPTKPSGQLVIRSNNGTVYEGEVSDGQPNGQGTLTNQRGSNEYGEWRNGIEYRVNGKIVFPNGTKEVGTWNNDGSASGGTIVWPDGRQYKGHWKFVKGQPDIPTGQGEMTWPDGRKYTGQFDNGTMDGPGKMTYPDGKVEAGTWKAGKFIGAAQ